VIDRKAIHDADVTVTFADRPAAVADFGFATGALDPGQCRNGRTSTKGRPARL
jgi:hypothetical protein